MNFVREIINIGRWNSYLGEVIVDRDAVGLSRIIILHAFPGTIRLRITVYRPFGIECGGYPSVGTVELQYHCPVRIELLPLQVFDPVRRTRCTDSIAISFSAQPLVPFQSFFIWA